MIGNLRGFIFYELRVTNYESRNGVNMKRIFFFIILILIWSGTSVGGGSKIWQVFDENYPSAKWHHGLETAAVKPDFSKIAGYVVLMKGGIPAERAEFYISWGEYDYRGVTIEGDKVKTRRGSIYTFLKSGDVMAIAKTNKIGRTFYLKLISPDVYIPDNRREDKRHSRVTTAVGIKLPKDVYDSDNTDAALNVFGGWFKPFTNLDDAKAFADTIPKSR